MQPLPPKYPLRFLRWFCREDFIDEVEGDLLEIFSRHHSQSPRKARWHFMFGVVLHLRLEYLKVFHRKHPSYSIITASMIQNYLNLAFRNLWKRTAFSFINIFGLAMGVAASLMILNYIDFEMGYDKFHANAASIYRINRTFINNGEAGQPMIPTTYGLGPALKDQIPEVQEFIRTHDERLVVSYEPQVGEVKAFHENKIQIVDSTFLKVFTFQAVTGSLSTALDAPNSIVLTRTTSQKYFGNDDPLGKSLKLAGGRMDGDYTVTAVLEDVPQNSHFNFDVLLPMHNIFKTQQYSKDDGWGWNNFATYIQLNNNVPSETVERKLPAFCERNINPKWKQINGSAALKLQPLRDIRLHPGLRHDVETISKTTIYFFGLIAVFILVIAWINYISLSTARAMERSREVGIKKAIGAHRIELITQFLFESIVINFIAMLLAVILAITLLPTLSDIIGKRLSFDFMDARLWFVLSGLFIVGTLASGIYPAFVLSSFRITSVLKGQVKGRGLSLRKSLVVFQFASSLLLIAGTFGVYRQLSFMRGKDTGLQMDQMLVIPGPGTLDGKTAQRRLTIFKSEVMKIAGVQSVATSGAVPAGGYNWGADIRRTGTPESNNKLGCVVWIDPDFIPTYKIPFVAGKNFDASIKSDMKSVIINEAALAAYELGTAEEALNEQLILQTDTVQVIGVLKNYNWSSLKTEVVPFVFAGDTIVSLNLSIHLEGNSINSAMEAIEKVYKELLPNEPYEYSFLDDSFNAQYRADQQFGNIFGLFAGLAVAISCLGLWGLASFTTAQKLKEIGVRKVLGASVMSIVYLLCAQFLKLVVIAALIGLPLAWYSLNSWLDGFAYKVGVGWSVMIIPALALMAISMLTVSLQVIKGALMNPVKVLRSE